MGGLWSKALLGWRSWYSYARGRGQEKDASQIFIAQVLEAVEQGEVSTLRALEQEARTSIFGGLGYDQCSPPLMLVAASQGHVSVVRYLLELELDVDATDVCGMSALHEACKRGRHACLDLLLPRSRDIDKRDVWGRTPLIKALVYRNNHAARLLLEKGANPNAVDNYGMTPLSTAIDYNMLDMVQLLVHHGADLNLVSRHHHQYSGPPLYRAINNQNLTLVKELLRLGATTQPSRTTSQSFAPFSSLSSWGSNLGFTLPQPAPPLPYENAVLLAMSELVKRSGQQLTPASLDILMTVLAAHGSSLGSSPEVLARVLLASGQLLVTAQQQEVSGRPDLGSSTPTAAASSTDVTSMLLLKLHVCSSSCQEPASLESLAGSAGRRGNPGEELQAGGHENLQQQRHEPMDVEDVPTPAVGAAGRVSRRAVNLRKTAVSLHTQARRVARRAMMASGRNVIWASHRLTCPPALKSLLLLKDVDRAFSSRSRQLKVF